MMHRQIVLVQQLAQCCKRLVVTSYQLYTIRRLDQKESSIRDTDQYKLINIKDALSNKLSRCFLFPNTVFDPRDIYSYFT